MKSRVNIPIFIPHLGCPNTCVFCNQKKISGHEHADFSSVEKEIDEALSTVSSAQTAQIAYFGGSFTGICREDMICLLSLGKKYIDRGLVSSIRISTRPDYINGEILDILEKYGVSTIELGLQSMKDSVLTRAKRGHTAAQAEAACRLIKSRGFELVCQMMTGLPESSPEDEIFTAEKIVSLGADAARIYPTVVFRGTELEEMAKAGEYELPSSEELISRTVGALKVFAKNGVPVIRIGLQAGEAVLDERETYSHTYHSAMGEICISRIYKELIEEKIPTDAEHITVYVGRGCTSKAVGHRQENKKRLLSKYDLKSIKFKESPDVSGYDIIITNRRTESDETENS